jgi:hypothetical protein
MNKNDVCQIAVNNFCVQEFNTCVTGGGLAALVLGIKLLEACKQPFSVCVLDPSIVPCSPNAKSPGFGPSINYADLARNYKRIGARGVYSSVKRKFSGFAQLLRMVGADSDMCRSCGTYEVLSDIDENLLAHLDEINRLLSPFFGECVFEVRQEMPKQSHVTLRVGETLIFNKLGWQINPGRVIVSLLKRFQESGGVYLTGCQLVAVEQNPSKDSPHSRSDYLGTINFSKVKLTIKSNCSTQNSLVYCQNLVHCARTNYSNSLMLLTEPLHENSPKNNWYFAKSSIRMRNVGSQLLFEMPCIEQALDTIEVKYAVDRCQSLMPGVPIRSALCWKSNSGKDQTTRIHDAVESIKIFGRQKLHSWIISDADSCLGGEVQVALRALNLISSKDPKL